MLDNSVAGGIAGGMSAFDTLVKEAAEEASLDPELVRRRARTVGVVSYYYQTDDGWLQPEVEFVYDMRVEPGEVRLAPMDGEVESFEVRHFFSLTFWLCCWVMRVDADSLCRSTRLCRICVGGNSSQIVRLVRRVFSSQAIIMSTYLAWPQVLLEFLVRHGYLTPENEPRYLEINQRLHGQFDIERW